MSTEGARQAGSDEPSKTTRSIGGMTAVGIGLLVITIAVAIANGGPTVVSYVMAGFAVALLIGGRIVDEIRARR